MLSNLDCGSHQSVDQEQTTVSSQIKESRQAGCCLPYAGKL